MTEIPTLKELREAFDRGEIPDNPKAWYVFYPSDLHKEKDSKGFMPHSELVKWSALHKEIEKKEDEIFWKH